MEAVLIMDEKILNILVPAFQNVLSHMLRDALCGRGSLHRYNRYFYFEGVSGKESVSVRNSKDIVFWKLLERMLC
jgi:hypothetical protein